MTANKIHIRSLFVLKYLPTSVNVDIGILTDSYLYIDMEMYSTLGITSSIVSKIYDMLFKTYVIDSTTDVMLTNTISDDETLYMLLKILKQQIDFDMMLIDKDRIPRRISSFHRSYIPKKAKLITVKDVSRLWKKIIEYNKCPWIDRHIDSLLLNTSKPRLRRKRFLRLAMYYMLVKKSLYLKTKRYIEKKKLNQD